MSFLLTKSDRARIHTISQDQLIKQFNNLVTCWNANFNYSSDLMECAESQPDEITQNNIQEYHKFMCFVSDLLNLDSQAVNWPDEWNAIRESMPQLVLGIPVPFLQIHHHRETGNDTRSDSQHLTNKSKALPANLRGKDSKQSNSSDTSDPNDTNEEIIKDDEFECSEPLRSKFPMAGA